ncbi:oxygenase MpaB family protein [Saccharopolyspora sp. CA-218241]|uniref:oxygenase MpaB family protein n=1 Tax=Saccharopolyspora sp. CA-218241 TaxID=3240027 RepID=UPI003D990E7A
MPSRPRAESAAMHRVVREGAILAGGARAILLQIAVPGIGRGVHEHSDFAYRPVERLRTTLTYVYCMTYGTDEEVRTVTRLVNRVHGKVRGPGYRAIDPELQLWVAATLYDTATLLHERLFGPLDEETADRVYQEYAVLGTALQVPPELWPADRAAFRAYWDDVVATTEVTDDARAVAHDLLHPSVAPRWVRLSMPLLRFLTAGMLPPRLRAEFGLTWDRRRQRRYDALFAVAARIYPKLPPALREAPKEHYLRQMRRLIARGREPISAA